MLEIGNDRPARPEASLRTVRYMSGQSIARWTPSQTSRSAVEWCISENVSPTPSTTASKSDMGTLSLRQRGGRGAPVQALHDLGRAISGDVHTPAGELLELAGAHLGQL